MRPKLEYLNPSELVPYERNARTHSDVQIEQIKASIAEFGFTNPVLIDRDGMIIAGHGRATAAKEIGLETVPVIRLGDLTPEQVKALRIADTRLALNAGWDEELLRIELSELEDFDLDILVFSLDELDALVYSLDTLDEGAFNHPSEESEEIFIEPPSSPVSRPGDVWELGPHRLLCGDSTKPEHVSEVMAGAPAALYLTDPPYNVSYTGGSTKERRAIDNYSMPAESFDAFLTAAFTAADAHKSPGSAFYIWHASKALLEFVSAYCDVIVERWERETGKKAKRIEFSSCIS